MSIKLIHAALSERGKDIVVRGVLHPQSLENLKVASYQREILVNKLVKQITDGIREGDAPDILLGMRGCRFTEHKNGEIELHDDVYIIDGLQRQTAALSLFEAGEQPHLGAIVYLDTDEEWERKKFRAWNVLRTKLSPNINLRNARHDNEFMSMLYDLCNDPAFILSHRVSWNQKMKRNELMTGVGLLKVTSRLHSRFKPGLKVQNVEMMSDAMLGVMQLVGRKVVRENIKIYWQTIDDVFGIQNITYTERAGHLRQAFNVVLAQIFAEYQDFWKDATLYVAPDLKRKLRQFPMNDPHIVSLCSSSIAGPANNILTNTLVSHINKGRRTGQLKPYDSDNQYSADAIARQNSPIQQRLNAAIRTARHEAQ